jgi:hypothetical protein
VSDKTKQPERKATVRWRGYEFTREEFWGTPREALFWLVIALGSPLFLLWALQRFPLADPNDSAYLYGFVGSYALSCLLVYRFRMRLFTRGELLSYKVWVGLLVAVPFSFVGYGVLFALNAVVRWRP